MQNINLAKMSGSQNLNYLIWAYSLGRLLVYGADTRPTEFSFCSKHVFCYKSKRGHTLNIIFHNFLYF
jgi:hypothetical protein